MATSKVRVITGERGYRMTADEVLLFRPYPLQAGQKITIDGGPRSGDWHVVGVNERKVKLRCPISEREFEWNRFCYLVERQEGVA
jgi:hypothetical protein